MADELRVVRGTPTAAELAALVGVLMLRRQTATEGESREEASPWTASARPGFTHRDGRPSRPSAGAWRASALPR
jgi:hypothetical protein